MSLVEVKVLVKNKNIKQIIIAAVLLVLICAGICSIIFMKSFFVKDEIKQLSDLNIIYNNVYIRGDSAGGLTIQQASEHLNKLINGDYAGDKKIYFRLAGSVYEKSFTYPELGMGFDVNKAVSEAYNFGRNSDGSTNFADVTELDMGGKYIDAEYSYSIDNVKKCLSTIEDEVNSLLKDENKTMDIDRTAAAAEELLRVNEYDATIIIATK